MSVSGTVPALHDRYSVLGGVGAVDGVLAIAGVRTTAGVTAVLRGVVCAVCDGGLLSRAGTLQAGACKAACRLPLQGDSPSMCDFWAMLDVYQSSL